jgi:hypothetical protein
MEPNEHEGAMRRDVRSTLKANPAATYETMEANWRYQRHGTVDESEQTQLRIMLEQERVALAERTAHQARGWWQNLWGKMFPA